jgi:hypothetical protein
MRGQALEPGVDAAAEDADANQDHDRDRRDQQSVFDDILSGLVLNEPRKALHATFPLMAQSQ